MTPITIAGPRGMYMVMSEARKTHHTQSLVEMLKVNFYDKHDLYRPRRAYQQHLVK
jgi:hypothetical protein